MNYDNKVINTTKHDRRGMQWLMWLGHQADDWEAHVQDPVAAMRWDELLSLTPTPADPEV